MALFTAARRAAASSVPLLLRASGSSGAHRGAALLRPVAAAARSLPRAMPFSSSPATWPATNSEILSIIESEIKCAKDCDNHDRVEEIPENFRFQIIDEKGMNVVTLRRTYQGEQIKVLVHMPSLVTGDVPEHDQDDENKDEGNEGDEKQEIGPSDSSVPLTVTISKGDGPTLEFACTAYPDEIIIDSLSVTQPSGDENDLIAYEGPDFNDLDENLRNAFYKYLEMRGITPLTTNFMHEYMINKDSREYLLWLMKLKDFFKQ